VCRGSFFLFFVDSPRSLFNQFPGRQNLLLLILLWSFGSLGRQRLNSPLMGGDGRVHATPFSHHKKSPRVIDTIFISYVFFQKDLSSIVSYYIGLAGWMPAYFSCFVSPLPCRRGRVLFFSGRVSTLRGTCSAEQSNILRIGQLVYLLEHTVVGVHMCVMSLFGRRGGCCGFRGGHSKLLKSQGGSNRFWFSLGRGRCIYNHPW